MRNGTRFPKTAFELDWEEHRIRCPNQQEVPFEPGETVQFPPEVCAACPLRERCTTSPHGRSVHIHLDEALLGELRQGQLTPTGRARLRERVAVEHTLAHGGSWQGRRARYRGTRKNLFDLRRCAVVHNLHVSLVPLNSRKSLDSLTDALSIGQGVNEHSIDDDNVGSIPNLSWIRVICRATF